MICVHLQFYIEFCTNWLTEFTANLALQNIYFLYFSSLVSNKQF